MYVNYYCLSMFIYESNRSDYIAVSYQIVLRFSITVLEIKTNNGIGQKVITTKNTDIMMTTNLAHT